MRTVLFACVHNAGRSQMAAALFNRMADPSKARAISAGTEPGARVHPEVVAAMAELGIDLSTRQPLKLTDDMAAGVDLLVTMGCGETCPVVPGAARDDWPLEDPKGKSLDRVREIRSAISSRVQDLLVAKDLLPWTVRSARPDDLSAAEDLLRAAGLPVEGVAEHFDNFTVAVDMTDDVAGVAGFESYGAHALLRSLVVGTGARMRGLGHVLMRCVLAKAHDSGAAEVYLLTTTAERFFERRGFQRIDRSIVPKSVASSAEFNGACPDTATVMRLRP